MHCLPYVSTLHCLPVQKLTNIKFYLADNKTATCIKHHGGPPGNVRWTRNKFKLSIACYTNAPRLSRIMTTTAVQLIRWQLKKNAGLINFARTGCFASRKSGLLRNETCSHPKGALLLVRLTKSFKCCKVASENSL